MYAFATQGKLIILIEDVYLSGVQLLSVDVKIGMKDTCYEEIGLLAQKMSSFVSLCHVGWEGQDSDLHRKPSAYL